MGTLKELENQISEIGKYLDELKVPRFLRELVNELSKDFRFARDHALAQATTDDGLRVFKDAFRDRASVSIKDYWADAPWFLLLLKPFIMSYIMKGFRWVWRKI